MRPNRGIRQRPVSSASSLRVLIADDEQALRLVYRANLETEGMEVVEAATGTEAVALAIEAQPDVALLDISMPRLSGFEVAARLRELYGETIGLVFITAGADPALPARAASFGGGLIAKPFNPLTLAEVVMEAADRRRGA